MNQRLTSSRFPYLPVSLRFSGSPREFHVEAFIDTGFEGYVMLPETLVPMDLRERALGSSGWLLGDGTETIAPYYIGMVRVGQLGRQFVARISILGDEVLVGRRITDHFSLLLDHGREVVVEL